MQLNWTSKTLMKVTKETLHKMAHLARLEVDPKDEPQLINDLTEILTWVEKLNELDTSDVEPLTHMSAEVNLYRKDKAANRLDRKDALKVAPDHNEQFFIVPKVIKNK